MVGRGQINTKDFYMQNTLNILYIVFMVLNSYEAKAISAIAQQYESWMGHAHLQTIIATSDPGDEELVIRACTCS